MGRKLVKQLPVVGFPVIARIGQFQKIRLGQLLNCLSALVENGESKSLLSELGLSNAGGFQGSWTHDFELATRGNHCDRPVFSSNPPIAILRPFEPSPGTLKSNDSILSGFRTF